MSKVAINGRTLPLIPVAAGLAGVMALGAFMIMPQSVLEAMVWQTRLDTILPAAQPPLGGTARLLVAIAAAALAAGLTALLAWKFSGLTTPKKRRRRRGMGQSDTLAALVIAPASAESAAPVAAPVAATADVADEEKTAVSKASFLDRFRRKKVEEEEEIDLENMPNLRRRDFHPDAPARRPLFADAELPGKTLDSVEPVIDMPASATPAPTPFGSTPSAKYPSWAYEEKCDLSGQAARLAAESHAARVAGPEAVEEPVAEPVLSATEPAAENGDQPSFTHAPGSAGTADWDDPSAFDQYMESQAEEARERELEDQLEAASLAAEPLELQVEPQPEPQIMPASEIYAEPAAFAPEPVVDARPFILNPVADTPVPEMPAPEMPVFAEAAPAPEPVEPDMPAAPVAAIPQAAMPEATQAQWLETELAKTEIGSESVDMLMARLEAGMARRATRREAQRAEAVRKAELQAAAPAPVVKQEVLPPVTAAPLAPMTGAETPTPQPAPAPSANPFAAIDPLANLADKEAEVDEALRAALSTLERMNRRAG
ncbi:hypothetical protein [Pseudonocardia sp. TMWB2A]|uniref:hypothetical protein n=1 Tax=Pseudonocardia sp. TMWB2A TaxID=687430 RepID=UPI00307E6C1E